MTQLSLQITANLLVTGGLLIWLTKRHADKLDRLLEDMATVKTILGMIKGDHEKVIRLEHTMAKADHDLNTAFDMIRDIKKVKKQHIGGKS